MCTYEQFDIKRYIVVMYFLGYGRKDVWITLAAFCLNRPPESDMKEIGTFEREKS